MIRMLAVTASRSEASEAAQHMPEGESGSESITGAKRRHVPPAYIPGCHQKRAVDALLFGVAYADPHSDQHARRNQQAIGGQAEIANMKKSGKHVKLDAPLEFDVREV